MTFDQYITMIRNWINQYVDVWVYLTVVDGRTLTCRFTIQDEIFLSVEQTGEKIPMLNVSTIMAAPPQNGGGGVN